MIPKIPPHNAEAEIAILSGMLNYPDNTLQVMQEIQPDDFYREAHIVICEAFFALKTDSALISIKDYLSKRNLLERAGGTEYLMSMATASSTSAGYKYYCGIVKDLSRKRQIIQQCTATAEACYYPHQDTKEILAAHKSEMTGIQSSQSWDIKSNAVLINEVFKEIERRAEEEDPYMGPKTGLENIDKHLRGLRPGTVTVLAAESGVGKSALALNICDYISRHYPGKAPYFTLESTDTLLMYRRLAARSGIALTRLNLGKIYNNEWPELTTELQNISADNNMMLIENSAFSTLENMVSFVEGISFDNPLSIVIIDYLQLMSSRSRQNTRHHEISYISRDIAQLAKRVKVPILLLSQVGKDVEKRGNRRPLLSDLKESGDIRNDAHNILFMYRKAEDEPLTEIYSRKGKDVGTWKTVVNFEQNTMRFKDVDDDNWDYFEDDKGNGFD